MAKSLDRFQPTLFEFPIQNNRTGWHPVWTSTLLVVPWSFDSSGNRIQNSRINSITFAIEKIIQITVAGHPQDYSPIGTKPSASPDLILFEVTLTYEQLLEHKIDFGSVTFYDQSNNVTENPEEGDWIEFTNSRGIQGRVEYLPDAEYFDLSPVQIAVDNLPSDRYIASWTVNYYERIKSDDILFCISDNTQNNKLDYLINHPGEVHEEMVKRTPALYFEDVDRKQDFTVNLYRPFADVLQDIFDESELFHGINWIKRIPPQLFPYLSYLIGVELPTQSNIQNIDTIRRRMLERGVELQKLKGSELAIKELFSILGFVVDIVNLWVNSDGNRFIAPNEPDPVPNKVIKDEIISIPVSQSDPMVADYGESGFGGFEIPLLYHNIDREIVVSAYIVEDGSAANDELQNVIGNLIEDPNYLTKEIIIRAPDGYLMLPPELDITVPGVEAYTRIVLTDIEVLSQEHSGLPIIRFDGIKYDELRDKLNINFADYKDLSKSKAYIFATYRRDQIEVPEHLKNNQSNRFDVQILSKAGDIEPSLYDYLVDSLFKFKAFHSLLRKISYDVGLNDFYGVTDFCNNSFLSQKRNSDANALMIPPACPTTECFITDECNEKNAMGGLRESDNEVRNLILEGLKEEYDRWHDVTTEWLDIASKKQDYIKWAKTVSNINIEVPEDEGSNFGQDRVSFDLVVKTEGTTSIELNEGDVLNMIYMGTYLESTGTTESIILNIDPTKHQILSSAVNVGVQIEITRKIDPTTYYITMILDIDHQTDIRSKIIKLDKLSTPDYCYKGRVRDFLDLNLSIQPKTIVRNRPCNLMMGLGVYYTLETGSLDNVRGWYNDYLKKSDQGLHYSNTLFFDHLYMGSPLRPGIEIEKQGFGFSGHRQLRGGLLTDFTHPIYEFRPWDISDDCFELINPLNAKLINKVEIDGTINEELVFDKEVLSYKANHIKPDIPTYSGESDLVLTHAVYSTVEDRPYLDLDNTVYTTDLQIETDSPVFETAKQCGDTGTSGNYTDYIDGYAALTGEFTFNVEDVWAERDVDSGVLIESDLTPTDAMPASGTYSSEVRVEEPEEIGTIQTYNEYDLWRGYRYDCDCLEYPCTDDERNCNYSFFKNVRGEYDFNNDHLEIDYVASLMERVSGVEHTYNSEITNWLNWDFSETEPNEFEFKDEYGIQYRIEFEENEEVLDITYETFQPRVWGEVDDGYIEDSKVFRKGILTTIRQVFVLENGQWTLNAEGTEQEITYRQTNYDCNWPTPEDKFIHLHEYHIRDEVKMRVPCGPHWTDPSEDGDIFSVWSGIEDIREWDEGIWDVGFWDYSIMGAGTGGGACSIVPFEFIDVWETYDTDKKYVKCEGVINT